MAGTTQPCSTAWNRSSKLSLECVWKTCVTGSACTRCEIGVCVCVCVYVCVHVYVCARTCTRMWYGCVGGCACVHAHVKGKCVHRSMYSKGGFGVCAQVMWVWVYACMHECGQDNLCTWISALDGQMSLRKISLPSGLVPAQSDTNSLVTNSSHPNTMAVTTAASCQ